MKNFKKHDCVTCAIRTMTVFREMNKNFLVEMNQRKTENLYHKGHIVFYENMKPFGVHCISEGAVKLYKTNVEGKQTILRIARAGEVIGMRALFSGEPYASTCEVIHDAIICFIDHETIFKLVKDSPKLATSIIQQMSHELGDYEKKFHSLAHKTVRERLAELFIELKDVFGVKEKDGIRLNVNLYRDEMAQMIGTAPETLIRLLSEFKEDGIVATKGRTIVILDEKKLTKTANLDI
jgi:CRP/FNR family transcriptional regulator